MDQIQMPENKQLRLARGGETYRLFGCSNDGKVVSMKTEMAECVKKKQKQKGNNAKLIKL